MKKLVFVIIIGLVFYSQVFAQSRPIMGYDRVEWGVSPDDVRRAFNLDDSIVLRENPDDDDPYYADLIQTNVTDTIIRRVFMFNKWNSDNYRLYRVVVTYRDNSDPAARTLRNLLETRFGSPTGFSTESSGFRINSIIIFGRYSPDLEVYIDHGTDRILRVYYTWKRFRDEYQASRLGL